MNSQKVYIIYKGTDPENDSNIDLNALGKSLIGFDYSIEELLRIGGIKGEVEIKATHIGNGSIVIELLIFIINKIPFETLKELYDFIQFSDIDLYNELNQKIIELGGLTDKVGENIIKRYEENPVKGKMIDLTIGGIISGLSYDVFKSGRDSIIGKYLSKMIYRGQIQKTQVITLNEKGEIIPFEYAEGLHKMIKGSKFNKAISPFIENHFDSINVTNEKDVQGGVIDISNFHEYIGDAIEILPEFNNGDIIELQGKITNYQSNKGDYMKIQINQLPKKFRLLQLYPPEDKDTSDYIEYYKKEIKAIVEIVRLSKFQRPKLKLINIEAIGDLFEEII